MWLSFSLVISTPQLICILLWCVSWKLHWMNGVCLQIRWLVRWQKACLLNLIIIRLMLMLLWLLLLYWIQDIRWNYWSFIIQTFMVIILIWRLKKIKNLYYDLLDEYRDVDESPVDNECSSHMHAGTSNYVAQMKFRLSEAMSSFDLFVNNSSINSK